MKFNVYLFLATTLLATTRGQDYSVSGDIPSNDSHQPYITDSSAPPHKAYGPEEVPAPSSGSSSTNYGSPYSNTQSTPVEEDCDKTSSGYEEPVTDSPVEYPSEQPSGYEEPGTDSPVEYPSEQPSGSTDIPPEYSTPETPQTESADSDLPYCDELPPSVVGEEVSSDGATYGTSTDPSTSSGVDSSTGMNDSETYTSETNTPSVENSYSAFGSSDASTFSISSLSLAVFIGYILTMTS
jgi:hypothetical protein